MEIENDDDREVDYDCGISEATWNESDCVYVHNVKGGYPESCGIKRCRELEPVKQNQTCIGSART